MTDCKDCGTSLKLCFSSWYCPNDCDRVTPIEKSTFVEKIPAPHQYWCIDLATSIHHKFASLIFYKTEMEAFLAGSLGAIRTVKQYRIVGDVTITEKTKGHSTYLFVEEELQNKPFEIEEI